MTPITSFRGRLADVMDHAAGQHVVVLAVDGLSLALACDHWAGAATETLESVHPTTSAAAWLSALTGLTVAEHGVPGVVFADPNGSGELVNVFDHHRTDLTVPGENIFSDAAARGHRPLAVLGDMEAYPCAWRNELLRHAITVTGHRFYTTGEAIYRARDPHELAGGVRAAVEDTLARHGASAPCLVWCFVELDRHVHHHGYDDHVAKALAALEVLALDLVERGAVVVAHADHGLTPTRHDPELQRLLDALGRERGFRMGGAGRTRWLYPAASGVDQLISVLERELPPSIRVVDTDLLIPAQSVARKRAGDVSLVAHGEEFLTDPAYRYDHGSTLPEELHTPLSTWGR